MTTIGDPGSVVFALDHLTGLNARPASLAPKAVNP
jgi:hypothetical protein